MKRFIHLVVVEEAISQDQHVEADQAIVMSQPKPTLLKSKMITHMMIRLKFKWRSHKVSFAFLTISQRTTKPNMLRFVDYHSTLLSSKSEISSLISELQRKTLSLTNRTVRWQAMLWLIWVLSKRLNALRQHWIKNTLDRDMLMFSHLKCIISENQDEFNDESIKLWLLVVVCYCWRNLWEYFGRGGDGRKLVLESWQIGEVWLWSGLVSSLQNMDSVL